MAPELALLLMFMIVCALLLPFAIYYVELLIEWVRRQRET